MTESRTVWDQNMEPRDRLNHGAVLLMMIEQTRAQRDCPFLGVGTEHEIVGTELADLARLANEAES